MAGRNIYSDDVEKTVESLSELLHPGCCAVIGVPENILAMKEILVSDASDQVGLVVVAEVKDSNKVLDHSIISQIEACATEEHGVHIASVKLIQHKTTSRTTLGKVKRFECLKQFIDGTLNLVSESVQPKRT